MAKHYVMRVAHLMNWNSCNFTGFLMNYSNIFS